MSTGGFEQAEWSPCTDVSDLYLVVLCPVLQLSGGEDGVEDDSDEVDGAGDEEDVMPLHRQDVVRLVVLRHASYLKSVE